MNSKLLRHHAPLGALFLIVLGLVAAGPLHTPAGYHAFADQRLLWGMPRAMDVLSNLPFLLVGLVGLVGVGRGRWLAAPVRWSMRAFFLAIMLTAAGSWWYHLQPDDVRIVWDRLPIALACGALLAAVMEECSSVRPPLGWLPTLLLASGASVALTSDALWLAPGDLRPYLALQLTLLVVVPLLQWRAGLAWSQRRLWLAAVGAYVLAKLLEVADAPVMHLTGMLSGHTLKHVFAALGAWLVWRAFRLRKLAGPAVEAGAGRPAAQWTMRGVSS
ncbi:hypothetical protein GCM10025771_37570 [Niveibacterium umoris]|uniref:Alkaline phytoceramidase n=1 Tax=Niveibacterium umoris TaxID=1193620 RepID=A0A840BFS6_9RHOO|nr:hypothetical protein [Niveibacterium umoris]MBB4011044.1 hypothetical protein [Niveibacterium umoris]